MANKLDYICKSILQFLENENYKYLISTKTMYYNLTLTFGMGSLAEMPIFQLHRSKQFYCLKCDMYKYIFFIFKELQLKMWSALYLLMA